MNMAEIYIDMDGVLVDFECGMNDHGIDVNHIPWDDMGDDFFNSLRPIPGAVDFYRKVVSYFETVRILSGPTLHPGSFSGKAKWVERVLGNGSKYEIKRLLLVPSDDKMLLSKSKRILIDDRLSNIQGWVSVGGIGIHVTEPNPQKFGFIFAKITEISMQHKNSVDAEPQTRLFSF